MLCTVKTFAEEKGIKIKNNGKGKVMIKFKYSVLFNFN